MTERYYCIQIHPNLEKTVEFHLDRQNFFCFFPKIISKSVTEPLFKGYGFVRFDIDKGGTQWRSINGTRGVIGLLPKWTLLPDPMTEGFVEYFLENGPVRLQEFEGIVDEFYPGLIVKIKDGLLKDRRAQVISVRNKLLEIMVLNATIIKNNYTGWISKELVIPWED